MEKAPTDATQAKAAERVQGISRGISESPLHDEAAQKLRGNCGVLAEGNLRVANHYMILKRYVASINRTVQTIQEYPDYSRQDEALWVLGQALEKQKKIPNAGYYYGKIVSDHPLSPLVENARKKLEDLNLPIPEVNQQALARAQADQEDVPSTSFMGRVMSMFSKKPNVSSARRSSRPSLELGPERINLDAAKQPGPAANTPPPADSSGDVGTSVGVEIINRSATSATTPDKSKPNGSEKKN
jgi:hypothetical protein